MNVLALDLATVTGWAWGVPGKVPNFGSMRLVKPGGPRAEAYRTLRAWLDERLRHSKPDLIVYETPMPPSMMGGQTNIGTTRLLFGLAEHLEEWAHERLELREAMVSQVRAHFIGRNYKSSVAKPMTIARCRELHWLVTSSDEADACALWDYQCCFLRPDLAAHTTELFQT